MKFRNLLLVCALTPLAALAADVAYSPPVGGMTISVPAGQTRSVSLPVVDYPVGNGAVVGRLTGVGSNYLDVSDANWTPASFSNSANPYYVRFKSGAASGRVVSVTSAANTSTRVYVNNDGVDLTMQGGPVPGDSYELILADTLGSLFGSTSLMGGADYLSADNVQVWGGASWLVFYYNTVRSRWERSTDIPSSPSRDNFVLRPDRGFMITRRASSDFNYRITGLVPVTSPKHFHSRPGTTFLSDGLPVSITLGELALQGTPGWISGSSPSTAVSSADLLQMWGGASWLVFYYDSSLGYWRRTTDISTSPSRNTVAIPAGRPIMVRRLVSNGNSIDGLISVPLPYSIN